MLFDIRRIRVHTLTEFAREYVMIVVGILTALGLEHVATHRHDVEAARDSRARIVQELRQNLAEVRHARAENARRQEHLEPVLKVLEDDVRAGLPRQEANRHVVEGFKAVGGLQLGFERPTLRHEAWDVAVADQSIAHVEPAALRGYAAAYAAQRDFEGSYAQGGLFIQIAPRVFDAFTELRLGRVDALELFKSMSLLRDSLNSLQGNTIELQQELEKALAADGTGTP